MTEAELEEACVGPPMATEIAQGVTLFTLDGTQIGNAIVVQKVGQCRAMVKIDDDTWEFQGDMEDVWLIETDFGNQARMSVSEIRTAFTLGRKSTYPRWFDDRLELIAKRTAEL